MIFTDQNLEMAKRHVADGEEHVARVERTISRRIIIGLSTLQSEELLTQMYGTLARHREHLYLIRDELGRNDEQ